MSAHDVKKSALGSALSGTKSLSNSTVNGAKKNVSDLEIFGNGDTWQLICKASSQAEGWMKSTKAMPLGKMGVLVQVTTQQRNPDGSYAIAEAVTFVPGVKIALIGGSKLNGRFLQPIT